MVAATTTFRIEIGITAGINKRNMLEYEYRESFVLFVKRIEFAAEAEHLSGGTLE